MKVSIIGTGHVGLVTGACFAEKGHHVLCVDADEEKIEGLLKGVMPFYEPEMEDLVKRTVSEGNLIFGRTVAQAVGGDPCEIPLTPERIMALVMKR